MTRQKLRGNTAKGDAFEQEIADDLLRRGAIVEVTKMNRQQIRTRGGWRWITKRADFFTSIDIIAFLPHRAPVFFIQATTARGMTAEKMRKIDATMKGASPGRELVVLTRGLDGKTIDGFHRVLSGWAPIVDWSNFLDRAALDAQ